MKINRKLNLVIPVETETAGIVHVHSMPIGREVFERFYKVIACTLTAIFEDGVGRISGPRVAALMLRQETERLAPPTDEARAAAWEAVQTGLFGEIHRLTSILMPGSTKGWELVPYDEAVKRGVISADDAAEVDNALAFFTVVSSMMRGKDLDASLEGSKLWGGSTTSLNSTAYANSLTTSTEDANSGEKNQTSPPLRSTG